jgi:hypothetical protein
MPVRRVFVSALWILTVASLVMLPKFVVSRNQDTQMETCDPMPPVQRAMYRHANCRIGDP